MFNIRTFEEGEKSNMSGPTPRVYVSRLLQWIDYRYIPFINEELKEEELFVDDNEYRAEMFQPTFKWHFSRRELYKHATNDTLTVRNRDAKQFR